MSARTTDPTDVKTIASGVSDVHLTVHDVATHDPTSVTATALRGPLPARPVKLNRNRSLSLLADADACPPKIKSASTPSSPARPPYDDDAVPPRPSSAMGNGEIVSGRTSRAENDDVRPSRRAEDVRMTDADDLHLWPVANGAGAAQLRDGSASPRGLNGSVVTVLKMEERMVTKRFSPRLSLHTPPPPPRPLADDMEEDMVDIEGDSPLTPSEPMSMSSSASATPAGSSESPTDTRFPSTALAGKQEQSSPASPPASTSSSPNKPASSKRTPSNSTTTATSHPPTRRKSQPTSVPSPRDKDIPTRVPSPAPIRRRQGPQLWDHLPRSTEDAKRTYTHIEENQYKGSATGKSIAEESMPCECAYERKTDPPEAACGDDSVCINRMMFIECTEDDCPSGPYCNNRR
ncbi:hypothetical protein BC936DRAFT_138509 [Jimgerdemannia flammicorona]|uniref:AWS domain-containing protein n=1 Tax=Jimgerdemannia flammicorona TaxID=994334 RepID=A0A433C9J4_9FUNG|nr:hypothetical protein BC936DRAFT_138509 [Jimgerdemannia flammicorona]